MLSVGRTEDEPAPRDPRIHRSQSCTNDQCAPAFSPVWPPSPPLSLSARRRRGRDDQARGDDVSDVPAVAFLNCMKPSPDAPTPQVTVDGEARGPQRPATVELRGFKPNLDFDLFTIQHSPQTANGAPDANPSVGLGVVPVRPARRARTAPAGPGSARSCSTRSSASTRTWRSPPTNTFHLGFWFNNPADAGTAGSPVHAVQR